MQHIHSTFHKQLPKLTEILNKALDEHVITIDVMLYNDTESKDWIAKISEETSYLLILVPQHSIPDVVDKYDADVFFDPLPPPLLPQPSFEITITFSWIGKKSLTLFMVC